MKIGLTEEGRTETQSVNEVKVIDTRSSFRYNCRTHTSSDHFLSMKNTTFLIPIVNSFK